MLTCSCTEQVAVWRSLSTHFHNDQVEILQPVSEITLFWDSMP